MHAYHKKGFWRVRVDVREEQDRCFFLINEGSRAVIKKIRFEQVSHFDVKRLAKRFFSGMMRAGYFDDDLLKQGLDELVALYLKEGFLEATILRYDFVELDAGGYELVVIIDEGPRSFIHSVMVQGFPELESRGPFAQFKKRRSLVPFDMNMVQKQREWLLSYFNKRGHQRVEVKPEFKRDASDIVLIWHVSFSNVPDRFGKTVVLGSSTFPFRYIMQELMYQQGQCWNKESLNQSLLNLKDLKVFEQIQLYPDQTELDNHEKPLLLKLYKDDPYEVRLRAGLGLQQISKPVTFEGLTYTVGGSFLAKNPFYVGDLFSIDTAFTRSNRSVSAQYRRPFLWDKPVGFLVQAYGTKYQNPGFKRSNKTVYEVTQYGFLVGLQKKYCRSEGGVTVGYEWMETALLPGGSSTHLLAHSIARALNFDPRLLDTKIPFFFVEPTILLDCVDHKLYPTKGFFTLASLKGMFPLSSRASDSYFIRLLVEQSFFIPLHKVVLALRLRFGHIFHRSFRDIMPSERFYLGGANSVRSYDTDLAPPLGLFRDEKNKQCVVPQGGKSMLNVNIEMRFSIFERMSAVFFQDVGTLGEDLLQEVRQEGIVAATGFGIRYHTPIGPLRFDIGWKWSTQEPLERSYAWFLTFGHAF